MNFAGPTNFGTGGNRPARPIHAPREAQLPDCSTHSGGFPISSGGISEAALPTEKPGEFCGRPQNSLVFRVGVEWGDARKSAKAATGRARWQLQPCCAERTNILGAAIPLLVANKLPLDNSM